MGILIDIIVVALIALSVFLGYKKGFIELSVKLLAFLIALVITLILYKPISNLIINNTQIDENIQNTILDKVNGNSTETENENSKTQENNTNESDIVENVANEMKAEILPQAARDLSINIINAGIIIILYILIRIALKFVTVIKQIRWSNLWAT